MPEKRKYADRAEYLKKAVSLRRKKLRNLAISFKGERCTICGYNRCKQALEFHHLFQAKEFGISAKGYTRSWDKVKKELDKCVLVCANCHREIHQ
ncbi:MAG: HNH endonuclease, partial [Patescibacteria group bacterium]